MRRLVVFENVSLDGYFTDSKGDMSWAKQDNDEEFNDFTLRERSSIREPAWALSHLHPSEGCAPTGVR